MTELQEMALTEAASLISEAWKMLGREATSPADIARTGTHSANVIQKLTKAEDWLKAVNEDPIEV